MNNNYIDQKEYEQLIEQQKERDLDYFKFLVEEDLTYKKYTIKKPTWLRTELVRLISKFGKNKYNELKDEVANN